MIKVIIRAKYPINLATKDMLNKLTYAHTKALANYTVEKMQQYIDASLQRPGSTGNLKESIFAEQIQGGFGVGNINYLNQTVPYWYWINYGRAMSGRRIPPATRGYFEPGNAEPDQSSFRQGRFIPDSNSYFLNPIRPIEAHNYIEKTIADIDINAESVIGSIKI